MREATKGHAKEFQVGFFVFIALLVIAAFSFRITETPIFYSGTDITAYLDDATGLFKKSKVKMAGIDVGLVTDIRLEDGRAKVTLTISNEHQIPEGAQVIPRPLGILGDKYLEIILPEGEQGRLPSVKEDREPNSVLIKPGASSSRNAEAKSFSLAIIDFSGIWNLMVPSVKAQENAQEPSRKLKSGDVIATKNTAATMDDMARELADVTADLKIISSLLRQMLEGKDQKSPLGKTLKNTEELTENLNLVVKENRTDMRQVIQSLAKVSRSLDDVTNKKQQSGLGKDIQDLAQATNKLSKTIKHIESIASKIDSGTGTLGKLVNDTDTISQFNKALVTVNAALDRAERTRIYLEAIPEISVNNQETKTYIGMRLAPRDNTAYIGQMVVTPEGSTTRKVTRTTVDGGTATVTETEETNPSGLKFSAQYMKKFWNTGFRVGLFESTGVLAVDQYMFKDRFVFSAVVFDLSDSPNLKVKASFKLLDIFMISAGAERVLNSNVFAFVGFGLSFSDEDLKTVLLFPGVP